MKWQIRPTSRTRGSIMIMTAVGLVGFIAFIALVTDVGYMYYQKARIESAITAGWKAGMDLRSEIFRASPQASLDSAAQGSIITRINEVIKQNYPEFGSPGSLLNVEVTFPNRGVRVQGSFNFGLFFAKAINIDTATVGAAREGSGGDGVVPIGIPHGRMVQYNQQYYDITMFGAGQGFNPGEEYILRLGRVGPIEPPNSPPPSGADKWSFAGSLDFGAGANDYEAFFKYGYDSPINVNDRIWTENGEVHGPTDDARDFRTDPAFAERRFVIIPILDAAPSDNPINELSGKSLTRVIGFARFELISEAEYSQTPITSGGLGLNDPQKDTGQVRGRFVEYLVHPDEYAGKLTTDGPIIDPN